MTDCATTRKRLKEAETALHKMLTGKRAVEVEDQNGERVRYANSASDVANLRSYIRQLKAELGEGAGSTMGIYV